MADVVIALAQNPPEDPVERKKLYNAARELMYKTEDRHSLTHRIFFSGIQLYLADIATDLAIFMTLAKDASIRWTPAELAKQIGCDAFLLTRILRGLAAYGMISVDAGGRYGSALATKSLADPGVAGCIRNDVLTVFPVINALPQFLRQNGHENPADGDNTAFQIGHHTDEKMWTWMATHPENLKAALINMEAQRTGQASWIDSDRLFPAQIFQPSTSDDDNRVLFVDVGSGAGHQSIALRKAHPTIPGRIILQDLPYTIKALNTGVLAGLRIEAMEHDAFNSQPISGAKVYYIRNVLHNFPDERCHVILRNIRAAAGTDSVLIIDEMVVKEPDAQWQQVNYDIIMMGVLSAEERTLRQWEAIFEATGFQLKEVREYDENTGDSIIIAGPI